MAPMVACGGAAVGPHSSSLASALPHRAYSPECPTTEAATIQRLTGCLTELRDDVIGDFGFSGNGAAGFELDRIDPMLGSDQNITILAQSYDTANEFMLVPEEQLTHLTNLSGGPEDAVKRADMVYFETPEAGECFQLARSLFVAACRGIILTTTCHGYSIMFYPIVWEILVARHAKVRIRGHFKCAL